MPQLRPYQLELLNEAIRATTQHQRVVVQLPTGGGKSPIQATLLDRYTSKHPQQSALLLVDRGKLLEQMEATIREWASPTLTISIINSHTSTPPPAQLYIAMVETIARRINKPYFKHLLGKVGIIIVDEAHMGNFTKVLTHPILSHAKTFGFTATPIFASNKFPMNKLYNTIVTGKQVGELIEMGSLVQNYTLASELAVSMSDLSVKNGRIDDEQQGTLLSRAIYVKETVNKYVEWALGKKTIVYNANKSHNKIVCAEFVERGYDAKAVDDDTSEAERSEVLKWYRRTPDAILCNVGLYTKGFDEPAIECVMQNKKTLSLPLYLQMVGRGGRTHPNKTHFINIDMHRNIDIHGDWNWDRDWAFIFHSGRVKKDGVPPVKDCPKCGCIVPASTRVCSGLYFYPSGGGLFGGSEPCGYIWERTQAEIAEEQAIKLKLETKNVSIDALLSSNTFGHKSDWQIAIQLMKDVARGAVGAYFIQPDAVGVAHIYNECLKKVVEYRQKGGNIKLNAWIKEQCHEIVSTAIKSKWPEFETI